MGIKEQTVSVHIRGSYRYRRAPYNRNRRSKRASVSFPPRFSFLSFFCPAVAIRTRVPRTRSHYVRVHQLHDITRNHVASNSERNRRTAMERRKKKCASCTLVFSWNFSVGEKSFREQLRVRIPCDPRRDDVCLGVARGVVLARRSNYSTTYGSLKVRVQGISLIIAVRLAVYVAGVPIVKRFV